MNPHRDWFHLPLGEAPFTAIDTETTDKDASAKIIQFGICHGLRKGGQGLIEVSRIVLPMSEFKMHPEAQQKHRISTRRVEEEGTPLGVVLENHEVRRALSSGLLATYNGRQFDIPKINQQLEEEGEAPFPFLPHLDVFLLLCKAFWRVRKQEDWAKHFGLEYVGRAHDALADTRMTLQLVKKVAERFPYMTVGTAWLWTQGYMEPGFSDICEPSKYDPNDPPSFSEPPWSPTRSEMPATDKQLGILEDLGLDVEGKWWTQGEASPLIDMSPATGPQLDYLRNLGGDADREWTRAEVSKEIDRLKNRKRR